jgi:choice-of-anchor C domain-containing protein
MASPESHNYDLIDQLADDFAARYRRGERPSLQEYIDRYPDLAGDIRDLLPAMVEIEQVKEEVQPSQESAAAAAPALKQLGDFHVLREIGRGGMGVVYEAEQVSLGRRVALKVLLGKTLHDAKQKRRFEREARAAAKLHHTNIVPVFGVGEHEGLPYYVMQFIQGLGLDEVIEELQHMQKSGPGEPTGAAPGSDLRVSRRELSAADMARSLHSGWFQAAEEDSEQADSPGDTPAPATQPSPPTQDVQPTAEARPAGRLSDTYSLSSSSIVLDGREQGAVSKQKKQTYWQRVASIGAQVASALEHAHRQGILHRDVKPSNLLLDTRGTVWVTDFGLAKVASRAGETGDNLTHTGDILGTLRYMAPEAFDGRTDPRSDVHSLGLTLYELLALRPAFDEKERNKLIKQVTTTEPPRLDRINPAIPRDLATIVHKAMDRDPAGRYPSAGELAADLQRFIEDEPIHARRISLRERAWRWCRRNPAIAGLTAALILLMVGVTVASTIAAVNFNQLAKEELKARLATQAAQDQVARMHRQTEEDLGKTLLELDKYFVTVKNDQYLNYPFLRDLRRKVVLAALDVFESLLKDRPEDRGARAILASAYLRVGDVLQNLEYSDAAQERLQLALKLYEALAGENPEDANLQHALGQCYRMLGQTWIKTNNREKAIAAFTQALTIQEKLAERELEMVPYQVELAVTLQAQGIADWSAERVAEGARYRRRAVEIYRTIAQADPSNGALLSQYNAASKDLADTWIQAGLWQAAVKEYRDYLKSLPNLDPGEIRAREWVGLACLQLCAQDEAGFRKTCTTMTERFGSAKDPKAGAIAAWASSLTPHPQGDMDKLIERVKGCSAAEPGTSWLNFILGLALLRADKCELAIAQATTATRDTRWETRFLNYPVLAMAHHRLGHSEEALKYLNMSQAEWNRRSPLPRQVDSLVVWAVPTNPWYDWLSFELLYREAAHQITLSPPIEEIYSQVHQGVLYSRLGESEKAEREFGAFVARQPRDAEAVLLRGRLLAQVREDDRAERDFARAIELKPNDAQMWFARGSYFAQRGEWQRANADFAAVDRLKPLDPRLWIERGRLFVELGQSQRADADFARAAALAPDRFNRFIEAGWWVVGPYPAALAQRSAPELDPDPAKPVVVSGSASPVSWKRVAGNVGMVDLRAVFDADNMSAYTLTYVYSPRERTATFKVGADDHVRIWLNGDLVHERFNAYHLKDLDRVPVTLRAGRNTLLAKVSQLAGPHYLRFRIVDGPGDPSKTTDDYDDAIKLQPGEPRVWLARARHLARLGRKPEAERDFERAVTLKSSDWNDWDVWIARGRIYAELLQPDKAVADYNQALTLLAKHPDRSVPRHFFHEELTRYESVLEPLAKLRPQDDEFHTLMRVRHATLHESGPAGVDVKGNLLKNGSFEEGPELEEGTPLTLWAGSTDLTGWTVSLGNIDFKGTHYHPSHGRRLIDLDGFTPGGIRQSFATQVGKRYRVTFDLAGNPDPNDEAIKRLRVFAAGDHRDFAFDITHRRWEDLGWVSKSWEFTATDGTTTLEFRSLDAAGSAQGPLLDNVAVVLIAK